MGTALVAEEVIEGGRPCRGGATTAVGGGLGAVVITRWTICSARIAREGIERRDEEALLIFPPAPDDEAC